jgi:hypothetical protein
MEWVRSPKDFWAGMLFIAIGIVAVVVSSGYTMGTAARMGPGYFPRGLGGLLAALGAVIALRGVRIAGPAIPRFHLRPIVFVLVAVVAFGLTLPLTGVVLGTILLIFVTSYASHEFGWRAALVSGVALAITSVLVFIVGLKLVLPIWPWPWNQ